MRINGKNAEGDQDYNLDLVKWATEKPSGISACIRVRNDQQFLESAVNSILPFVEEVNLVVQPSDDNTLHIANGLADRNHKVNVHFYPYIPHWIDTYGHYNSPENSLYHLAYMSNWALNTCNYSWILKVEADVIALSSMAKFRKIIEDNPGRKLYYGLVLLNLAGENFNRFSVTNPRNWGMDEAIFPNHPDYHFIRYSKWESVNFFEHETRCLGWSLLHLKRCKTQYMNGWNNEFWLDFDRNIVEGVLDEYNKNHPYPGEDNPLGEDCLYEHVDIKRNTDML